MTIKSTCNSRNRYSVEIYRASGSAVAPELSTEDVNPIGVNFGGAPVNAKKQKDKQNIDFGQCQQQGLLTCTLSLIQICKQLLIHTSTCIFSVLSSYWLYRLKNENKDNRLLMADLLNNFIFQKNYPQNCQLLVSNHFGHFFQQFPTFRARYR